MFYYRLCVHGCVCMFGVDDCFQSSFSHITCTIFFGKSICFGFCVLYLAPCVCVRVVPIRFWRVLYDRFFPNSKIVLAWWGIKLDESGVFCFSTFALFVSLWIVPRTNVYSCGPRHRQCRMSRVIHNNNNQKRKNSLLILDTKIICTLDFGQSITMQFAHVRSLTLTICFWVRHSVGWQWSRPTYHRIRFSRASFSVAQRQLSW